jgi:hypothetical protein
MLHAALHRIRAKFVVQPDKNATSSGDMPNIGASLPGASLDPTIDRSTASPHWPMIGREDPVTARLRPLAPTTVVPIVGSKHGRGRPYAEAFAASFLDWLKDQTPSSALLSVEMIISMAATKFAPTAGMPMPPTRNLLGALKRSPGVRVKRDVRVRDARGDVIGKTTMYKLPTTAQAIEPVRCAA